MYIKYCILFMLIAIQTNLANAMQQTPNNDLSLSIEQNELICAINNHTATSHRISFTKIQEYKTDIKNIFNQKTYPYHYQDLINTLKKIEINKSILIISDSNKEKKINKNNCIAAINWLAYKITKLEKAQSPLLSYLALQLTTCEPSCLHHLQNDADFIEKNYDSLMILADYNPRFTPAIEINAETSPQSMHLKDFITHYFINVPDITLMQALECNVLSTFDSFMNTINSLYPHENNEKQDLIATLVAAHNNYNRIKGKRNIMKELYTQCLFTIKNPTVKPFYEYHYSFSTLTNAQQNKTLELFPDLYEQFIKIKQQTPSFIK